MEKYYIGLGTKDAEEGWIYRSTGVETRDTIELIEEFSLVRSISGYDKLGVAEITKEEYYSVANELENENHDEYLVAERVDGILNNLKSK